ncbi:hypothetical protein BGW36DRAFT_390444 [Talaromyces proteolyticus]|uniref:Uncharacterized protein n=1 Tax=Talaromyces proteolyticus TaxID=1131652 RepID=A0AAD4KFZ9_9EURO|nr:uncharacterized protein BGW36DRAFT_390444 [Talaromyces proteolyticus]KAH8690248.1 hypothetical protein BGW36DRAFT_390444 [Talaromyces proteolyticus]
MDAGPNKILDEYNGGYVIREGFEGPAVAYTSDSFSNELDQRVASAQAFENAVEHKGISENDLHDVFAASNKCSHPKCITPGQLGKCVTYTGCYICSSSGRRCI